MYKILYSARVSDEPKDIGVVAVLHCWQKKTQATAQKDGEIIARRYRSVRERFE